MGKPLKTSLPYAPGATPVYTVNSYDVLGRTLTTVAPQILRQAEQWANSGHDLGMVGRTSFYGFRAFGNGMLPLCF